MHLEIYGDDDQVPTSGEVSGDSRDVLRNHTFLYFLG